MVYGLWFMVFSLKHGARDLQSRAQGLGFKIYSLRFKVKGKGFGFRS